MKQAALYLCVSLALFAAPALARDGPPQERLKAADTNGDGMISREEAAAMPRLARHFDQIDANKDGQITVDEMRAAHGRNRAEHLKRLDVNGDGSLSRDEAKAAPRLAEHFDQLDTNKDGLLSRDEIAAARGRHGRGPGYGRGGA